MRRLPHDATIAANGCLSRCCAWNDKAAIGLASALPRNSSEQMVVLPLEFPMRSSRRPLSFARCAILATGLGFIGAAGSPALADDAQAADLWRRTAHGWERIDHMRAELSYYRTPDDFFITDEPSHPEAARWDIHPACLVAIQILAVTLAFRRWTGPA
jgi:hypothetical protein